MNRDAYVELLKALVLHWILERQKYLPHGNEVLELNALIEKTRTFLHNEFGVTI